MKIDFIKTKHYYIQIDNSKNRVYFSVLARWNGIEDFSNFFDQWKEIVEKLEPQFTITSDLRLMPILSKDIEKLFSQIQCYLIENGLFHVAEVVAMNDISNLQITRISNHSELPQNKFTNIEEAEEYLDKLIALTK